MNVLVAYASAHGSTRSVAENVGRSLSARHQVTTRPVAEIIGLDSYDAIVLGSAVHDGAWLPEAREFVLRTPPPSRSSRRGCSAWGSPACCHARCVVPRAGS